MLTLPPLSLYVHIPWCLKKCPYCDFNSHETPAELPEQAYIQALLQDLQEDLTFVQQRSLCSIFFGGGTPSLFSPDSIDYFLSACRDLIPFEENIEITLEANPGTFEQQKFSDFLAAGINRLSIGIQSFQAEFLTGLGRVHDSQEALRAAEIASLAGFSNINLDLMFGLPGQSMELGLADLQQALIFNPAHISWYQLTIEPNTRFYRYPPKLPDSELIDELQESGIALLADAGYERYEVSAYSRAGMQARHNLNYWQFGDYLGIGAGAHGKLTLPRQGQILRTRKSRQPAAYLQQQHLLAAGAEPIAPEERPLEFMMNALRLRRGVDMALFEARTGLGREEIMGQVSELRRLGLLEAGRLQTTPKGFELLNNVLQAFME